MYLLYNLKENLSHVPVVKSRQFDSTFLFLTRCPLLDENDIMKVKVSDYPFELRGLPVGKQPLT